MEGKDRDEVGKVHRKECAFRTVILAVRPDL